MLMDVALTQAQASYPSELPEPTSVDIDVDWPITLDAKRSAAMSEKRVDFGVIEAVRVVCKNSAGYQWLLEVQARDEEVACVSVRTSVMGKTPSTMAGPYALDHA